MGERKHKTEKSYTLTEGISYTLTNGLCRLLFGNTESFLTLDSEKLLILYDFFKSMAVKEDVAVIVVESLHEKVFLAGANVRELIGFDGFGAKVFSERGHMLFNLMEEIEKPIVAIVDGYALGGGFDFIMACDIRVATENAVIGQTACRMGIITGFGGTQRLPYIAGFKKAKELFFCARTLGGEEAYRLGIVNFFVLKRDIPGFMSKILSILLQRYKFARYKRTIKMLLNFPQVVGVLPFLDKKDLGGINGVG